MIRLFQRTVKCKQYLSAKV